jgi:hypothetical protein
VVLTVTYSKREDILVPSSQVQGRRQRESHEQNATTSEKQSSSTPDVQASQYRMTSNTTVTVAGT